MNLASLQPGVIIAEAKTIPSNYVVPRLFARATQDLEYASVHLRPVEIINGVAPLTSLEFSFLGEEISYYCIRLFINSFVCKIISVGATDVVFLDNILLKLLVKLVVEDDEGKKTKPAQFARIYPVNNLLGSMIKRMSVFVNSKPLNGMGIDNYPYRAYITGMMMVSYNAILLRCCHRFISELLDAGAAGKDEQLYAQGWCTDTPQYFDNEAKNEAFWKRRQRFVHKQTVTPATGTTGPTLTSEKFKDSLVPLIGNLITDLQSLEKGKQKCY